MFEFEFVMQPGARAGNLNFEVNNLHCAVTTLLLNSAVFPHTSALFITGSLISHCFAPLEVIYGFVKWVFKKHQFGLIVFHTCFAQDAENRLSLSLQLSITADIMIS